MYLILNVTIFAHIFSEPYRSACAYSQIRNRRGSRGRKGTQAVGELNKYP